MGNFSKSYMYGLETRCMCNVICNSVDLILDGIVCVILISNFI